MGSVCTTFPGGELNLSKPLAARPPSSQCAAAQAPLRALSRSPGRRQPWYPGSMSSILRIPGATFPFLSPAPLSRPLPQLAPHPCPHPPPHPAVPVNPRWECVLERSVPNGEGTSPRGIVDSICSSLAPALGWRRNPEVPGASEAPRALTGKGGPGTPTLRGCGIRN